jgi:tRNA 2-thiouridine synthesizing protein A
MMMKLNCLGDMCPVPLLKADAAMKQIGRNESIMVVTDHSCTVESLQDHFPRQAYTLVIEEPINGVWEVTITRKPSQPNNPKRQADIPIRFMTGFRPTRNPFSKNS